LDFLDAQGTRVSTKFFQLIEVMEEIHVIHSNFIKKLQNSEFYELRIKAGNEYRIVIFAIDHKNFNECSKAICLNGFIKKSTKDYKKAVHQAAGILQEYIKQTGQ